MRRVRQLVQQSEDESELSMDGLIKVFKIVFLNGDIEYPDAIGTTSQ